MSRSLVAVLCFCIAGLQAPAHAQFGAGGGANLADLIRGDIPSEPRLGMNGGMMANVPLGNTLRFQAELYYTQKGGNPEFDSGSATAPESRGSVRLDYAEVPGILRFDVARIAFASLGGAVGVKFRCTLTISESGAYSFDDFCRAQGESVVEKVDYSFVTSGGLNLGGILLELRSVSGLAGIIAMIPNQARDQVEQLSSSKNQVVSFNVRVPFGRAGGSD